jgi:hypothetical protein
MGSNFITEFFNFKVDGATHLDFAKQKELRLKSGKYNEFMNAYMDLFRSGELEGFSLGEKIPDECTVIVHLEFNYPEPEEGQEINPYKNSFIKDLVLYTQMTIEKLLDNKSNLYDQKDLSCAVVMTSPFKVAEHRCSTLTIYFPSIRMIKTEQRKILRPRLISTYKKENIQYGLTVAVSGDVSTYISLDNYGDYFPMLGCFRVSEVKPEYSILYYNEEGKEISERNAMQLWNPLNNMDAAKHSYPIESNKDYLPLILSVRYQGSTLIEVDEEDTGSLTQGVSKETPEEEICRRMLSIINMGERLKNPVFRTIIGKAIFNIYRHDIDLGFNVWFMNCRKFLGDSLEEEQYRDMYDSFYNRNYYTEVTLQALAKEDSPREYKKWDSAILDELVEDCITNLEVGCYSRALYHIYKLSHTFLKKDKKQCWYIHNGSYLEPVPMDDPGLGILRDKIKIYAADAISQSMVGNRTQQKLQEGVSSKCDKALKFLDKAQTISGVSKFLKIAFVNKTYKVSLNINPNIFCTTNCVLESTRSKLGMVIRPGLLEDYFTFHGDVPYMSNLSDNHPLVLKEREFSTQIYSHPDRLKYMDDRRTRELIGNNGEKSLTLKLGRPNAAKTTDTFIKKQQFGSYMFSGNTTMLTSPQGKSSSASPDSAHTDLKRSVEFDDLGVPNKGELNEGWLAQESGRSIRHTRFLFDDGTDQSATAEYAISANDIFLNPSEQIIIRTVVVNYESRNLDEDDEIQTGITVPETIEEQRKKKIYRKRNYTEKDYREFAIARLWRDVRNHSNIDWSRNTPRPKIIRDDTKNWWHKTDSYHKFIYDHIRLDPTYSTQLTLPVLYQCYVNWFKSRNFKVPIHDMRAFTICIRGVLGSPEDEQRDIYYRYKLYDPTFIDFVESVYEIVDDRESYILAVDAYNEYKNWRRETGTDLLRDKFSFIAYMSSSCVNYDEEVQGFRGLRKKSFNLDTDIEVEQ